MDNPETEVFDDFSLENVANLLGKAWPSLATYLSFDDAECQSIIVAFPGSMNRQSHYMLRAWREGYAGADLMGDLTGALRRIGRYDLLRELGVEILDDEIIKRVVRKLGRRWPELALYLSFDIEECQAIKGAFPSSREQAGQMLAHWRTKYFGDNPVEYLTRALMAMDLDLTQEIGPLQRLPPCPCGNEDPVKFKRYFSKGDDGHTRLIGLFCSTCGQEWVEDRFLFHPDVDKTRQAFMLSGVVLKKQLKIPTESNPAFQVKGCRTKIVNLDLVGDYLKVGDHITWHRPYIIWHHAIVSDIDVKGGRVKVIHWNKMEWGCGLNQIMENWVDLKTQQGHLYRIDYKEEITKVNTSELVLARARSRIGDTGYGLFSDNCEAFASYCKLGVSESCQVCWLYQKCKRVLDETVVNFAKSTVKAGCVVAKEYLKAGTQEFIKQVGTVSVEEGVSTIGVGLAETFERIGKGTDVVGAGLVLVFEGLACVWDLGKIYEKRSSRGGISRQDFIKTATQRVSEALCGAGLAIGVGLGGQAAGAAAGTIIFPGLGTAVGAFIGSIVGGVIGSFGGRAIGSLIGPPIGRALTSAIGTDDKAVGIEDIKPGDQVVFYGNLLHPRHHAIVVTCDQSKKKVKVVHNTYQKGVVEENVDFTDPVFRLIYNEKDCYPPDEVITRARSKIGDDSYTYSLARNNCKDFARWCKLK